ncbi:DUF736 family protein [Sphingomonas glacialis]|uniref:DUF736 family protein n=1 Tax=Sphingomonas glacialis TaxID=658225 RepID=UPI001F4FCEAD|nr:DUF736 family protein [Sphingomonas glacialis]
MLPKTSREDRSYMAVKLDDPGFHALIYANLVEADDGSFTSSGLAKQDRWSKVTRPAPSR